MNTSAAIGRPRWPSFVSFFLLAVTALGLGIPGVYLVALGGSVYYLAAGIILLISAVLVYQQKRAGLWLYAAFFLLTLFWSFWEVGFDGWALMPRLIYFFVGGIWLSTPWVRSSASF